MYMYIINMSAHFRKRRHSISGPHIGNCPVIILWKYTLAFFSLIRYKYNDIDTHYFCTNGTINMLQAVCRFSLRKQVIFPGPAHSVQRRYKYVRLLEVMFMKKKLVTILLVSALASAVFAGCSKDGSAAGDAAASDAAVADTADDFIDEELEEDVDAFVEDAEAGLSAAIAEAAPVEAEAADTAAAAAAVEEEETKEDAAEVEEYVDEDEEKDAEKTDAAADAVEEVKALIVNAGEDYIVRFGGNIYSSPEENDANIMYYAEPGNTLKIVERLDNYWYKVSYYLTGEGIEHIGYIQIQ